MTSTGGILALCPMPRHPCASFAAPRSTALPACMKARGIGWSSAGQFPRRVKITDKAVGWVEGEVIAWIKGRLALRDEIEAQEANLPPGARHRLRMRREWESEDAPAD